METVFIKIFAPLTIAFLIGILITPILTHFLYRYKAWKPKAGKGNGYGGGRTPIFDKLHKDKDVNTPRLGGVVIWGSVLLTVLLFIAFQFIFPDTKLAELSFFSRSQTWLPLFALIVGAVVGFIDDLMNIRGSGGHFAGGLSLWYRFLAVGLVSLFSAWWFYSKLEISSINLLGYGNFELGIFFIPFFMLVAMSVYMSSVIDGIDGLAGGIFMFIFTAYTGIALFQNQIDIAALCATLVGGILAFLWFNIPPARFYMTETGIMALTMALTIIAFMTDALGEGEGVSILPIVGILLLVTVASNVIQITAKKLFKQKVFLVAPIHHHFEALGWPGYKVTMRYWVLGFVAAALGMLLAILF